MNAYLLLSNGMVLQGESIGCTGTTVGEVVFATGMVGFQETLTDPSYYGQIITQTYPLIGNYGMNSQDYESPKIWAKGYIVREACKTPSNFRCEKTLDAFLKENNTIGIEGVDTRRLTRIIREKGVTYPIIKYTDDIAIFQTGYVPTTFFFDGEGRYLAGPFVGGGDYEYWSEQLEALYEK